MVAAVAKLQLNSNEIQRIEQPLKNWSHEFSGLSSLVTSAVWADHVKCREPSGFCTGMSSFYGLEIFNAWHYVNMPYNPHNISLDTLDSLRPLPGTGAVWLLSILFPEWSSGKPKANVTSRPNRHVSAEPLLASPSCSEKLPFLTWNLKLRFLIHILGDLHQPLHAATAFSERFPEGDAGGTKERLNLSKTSLGATLSPEITTLHELWDSCGGLYTGDWPTFTEADALLKAEEIIRMIPYATVKQVVTQVTDFDSIAQESHHLATTIAYSELFASRAAMRRFEAVNETTVVPYHPSDAYIVLVRSACRVRIAIAGYRLARILKSVAKDLDAAVCEHRTDTPVHGVKSR